MRTFIGKTNESVLSTLEYRFRSIYTIPRHAKERTPYYDGSSPARAIRNLVAHSWSQKAFQCRYSTMRTRFLKVTEHPASHIGSIRIISLDRPEARNAISQHLLSELSAQIEEVYSDEARNIRALIIASEVDNCFCAGADLKERRNMTTKQTVDFLSSLRRTFNQLSNLPIPTISAVASTALGGGLELALCTHLRVFASTAVVGLPETRLAIIPGAGGTYRLPALIGVSPAREMILTGRRVSGTEAKNIGLCNRLIEVGDDHEKLSKARAAVLEAALNLAENICEGGPVALRAAIRAVRSGADEVTENSAYDTIIETNDRKEALLAFQEKRKPAYRGN